MITNEKKYMRLKRKINFEFNEINYDDFQFILNCSTKRMNYIKNLLTEIQAYENDQKKNEKIELIEFDNKILIFEENEIIKKYEKCKFSQKLLFSLICEIKIIISKILENIKNLSFNKKCLQEYNDLIFQINFFKKNIINKIILFSRKIFDLTLFEIKNNFKSLKNNISLLFSKKNETIYLQNKYKTKSLHTCSSKQKKIQINLEKSSLFTELYKRNINIKETIEKYCMDHSYYKKLNK